MSQVLLCLLLGHLQQHQVRMGLHDLHAGMCMLSLQAPFACSHLLHRRQPATDCMPTCMLTLQWCAGPNLASVTVPATGSVAVGTVNFAGTHTGVLLLVALLPALRHRHRLA